MRYVVIALAIVVATGVSLLRMSGAMAAPANGQAISDIAGKTRQVTVVRGNCGRGFHRNRYGHCRPNP